MFWPYTVIVGYTSILPTLFTVLCSLVCKHDVNFQILLYMYNSLKSTLKIHKNVH